MSLTTIVSLFFVYKYIIIFILAILEGPILMTISGFILRLGIADFWPLYICLMAGDLVADIGWYKLGFHFGEPLVLKYGHYFGITKDFLQKVESVFHKHPNKILLLSKMTGGFGFALVVLITAGIVKIPFKKYLAFNLVGQFFWTGILMSVGYFFGNLYLVVNKDLQMMSVIAFFVILFFAFRGINLYLRNKDVITKI